MKDNRSHKYHYLYRTTCLINSNFYIGIHSTNNLEDGYLGSGNRVSRSIKKHGKENHSKEILEYCKDRESLRQRERELVDEELVKLEQCMNLTLGGGDYGILDEVERKRVGEKIIQKYNERASNKEWLQSFLEWCSKKSKEKWSDKIFREKMLKVFTYNWTGKKHKQETRELMSKIKQETKSTVGEKNSQFGKIWIKKENEVSIKIKKEDFEKYESEGWVKGRELRPESLENVIRVNKKRVEDQNTVKGQIVIFNPIEKRHIFIKFEELEVYTNKGWLKGREKGIKLKSRKKNKMTPKLMWK